LHKNQQHNLQQHQLQNQQQNQLQKRPKINHEACSKAKLQKQREAATKTTSKPATKQQRNSHKTGNDSCHTPAPKKKS